MKILKRLCVRDYTVSDDDGASFTLQRGREYTTSMKVTDGYVTVFTRYWFHVPVTVFHCETERMLIAAMRESGLEVERLFELARESAQSQPPAPRP